MNQKSEKWRQITVFIVMLTALALSAGCGKAQNPKEEQTSEAAKGNNEKGKLTGSVTTLFCAAHAAMQSSGAVSKDKAGYHVCGYENAGYGWEGDDLPNFGRKNHIRNHYFQCLYRI